MYGLVLRIVPPRGMEPNLGGSIVTLMAPEGPCHVSGRSCTAKLVSGKNVIWSLRRVRPSSKRIDVAIGMLDFQYVGLDSVNIICPFTTFPPRVLDA